MKSKGFIAYGVGVAVATLFAMPHAVEAIDFNKKPQVNLVHLWCLWFVPTFGPLILSAAVWMICAKVKLKWALHLVLVPVSITVLLKGMSLFLRFSGLDFHDGPAGDAFLLGSLYLLLTLLVHLSGFATELKPGLRKQTGVRLPSNVAIQQPSERAPP